MLTVKSLLKKCIMAVLLDHAKWLLLSSWAALLHDRLFFVQWKLYYHYCTHNNLLFFFCRWWVDISMHVQRHSAVCPSFMPWSLAFSEGILSYPLCSYCIIIHLQFLQPFILWHHCAWKFSKQQNEFNDLSSSYMVYSLKYFINIIKGLCIFKLIEAGDLWIQILIHWIMNIADIHLILIAEQTKHGQFLFEWYFMWKV